MYHMILLFFSFTFYPAYSRVSKEIVVLRLSHYVFSGGTQRLAWRRHQSEEIKILNISFPQVGIEPTTLPPSALLTSYEDIL